jgi:hypothetical protein
MATVSATSHSGALAIVANIRRQYQACLTAYAAVTKYNTDLANYNKLKAAYQKRYHTLKPQRSSKGKVTASLPKFTETQPTIPPGCPGPAATGGSTGSGGSS